MVEEGLDFELRRFFPVLELVEITCEIGTNKIKRNDSYVGNKSKNNFNIQKVSVHSKNAKNSMVSNNGIEYDKCNLLVKN